MICQKTLVSANTASDPILTYILIKYTSTNSCFHKLHDYILILYVIYMIWKNLMRKEAMALAPPHSIGTTTCELVYIKIKQNKKVQSLKKRSWRKEVFLFLYIWSHKLCAVTGTELVPASPPPLPQQQHCRCHRHSMRDEQSGGNSQLLHFAPSLSLHPFVFSPSLSPSPSALNMEELICSFCRQHLFLFIFLHVFFSPSLLSLSLSLSLCLRQGCAVRPFQSSGVVRSDGWLSTFCCLPLRSWEIYRLADYQAWKPISLSHSSLPSSIHACLTLSISLPRFQHLRRYQKKLS